VSEGQEVIVGNWQAAPVQAIQRAAPTPADLLRVAMDQGADLDRLEKLMELQLKWEANEARKSYVAAMAAFKASAPTIYKDKRVAFKDTKYAHATLGNVVDIIVPELGKHGLFHKWDTKQGDAGQVEVTCTIQHANGHRESTTLRCMEDTSGSKNAIQAMGSAVTYLQRYTLLALTGLAAQDQDDDGQGGTEQANKEAIELRNELALLDDATGLPAVKAKIAAAQIPPAEKQTLIQVYNDRRKVLMAVPV
jgi:hypothetical protein